MRLPYELFLALRYLRPKRTLVSVITLISVIGVMLGVAVLIIVISVMTGFDRELRERILGFNAHLRIFHRQHPLQDYDRVVEQALSHPEVRGAAPFVFGPTLVETQPGGGESPQIYAPFIRGIDPRREQGVSNLHTNVIAGEFELEGRSVLIGIELAAQLGVTLGDRIAIHSPHQLQHAGKSRGTSLESLPLPDDYEIRGIFDVGYYEYNAGILILSLENAQDLYGLTDSVHGVMVMLQDPFQALSVQAGLRRQLGRDYEVRAWTEDNSGILNALAVEKNVMFYLLFFIMIVAAFGIMNSLITFAVQKTHEIGMLKALGSTRWQVVRLFLTQSSVVGVLGVILGCVFGILGVHYRNVFLEAMRTWTQLELFPAHTYGFHRLPAVIVAEDVAVICSSAVMICLLAGALPAWIAARLQPVEAMRHE